MEIRVYYLVYLMLLQQYLLHLYNYKFAAVDISFKHLLLPKTNSFCVTYTYCLLQLHFSLSLFLLVLRLSHNLNAI